MKKKSTYLLLLIFFFSAITFIVFRYTLQLKNKTVAFYPLLERKGLLAKSAEWVSVKEKANKLIRVIRENSKDTKTAVSLGTLYIQEARVTGNYAYYDQAAMTYIDKALENDPKNIEALTLKSLLLLSQHHFSEGLAVAEKTLELTPYYAFLYGLLVDGNVEMGNYRAAVDYAEKMISLRPDIRSYSRVSYLREIHGDYSGAIEAMQMAVDAGAYGDEPTAWARVQLAKLYENTGNLQRAAMHYMIALEERPGYAYAIAGLGHIAMANKDYAKSISLYQQADSLINDYSFKEQLSKLYSLTGDQEKAEDLIKTVVNNMSSQSKKAGEDETIGHYADGELANAYLLADDHDNALQHALAEYNRRPDNIDVNETVAWIYYKIGESQKAVPYIQQALKTGSKNPTLISKAALIYAKTNNRSKAKELAKQSVYPDAIIDPILKKESQELLATLL